MTSPSFAPATESARTAVRRLRVLVADDSSVARQSIAGYLDSLGHIEVCALCADGRSAVDRALRDQPDLALLDLQMPVMSGLEAAQVIRANMPHTAIIMMSVHDHPEIRAACIVGGADAFVVKAALATQFENALETALTAARHVAHGAVPISCAPSTAPTNVAAAITCIPTEAAERASSASASRSALP